MFAAFFYLLRQRGLHVYLNEWMTLLEGMEKGLLQVRNCREVQEDIFHHL